MDVDAVKRKIADFAREHRTALSHISARQGTLLELGAAVGVQEHYRSNGFDIETINPRSKNEFVVKAAANGWPWNFSHLIARRESEAVEIHMNLKVRSAHDSGIYCVDIAVVKEDVVPKKKPSGEKWLCVSNQHLLSFAEVKRLAIYPMLLAQFIGIVHEIKPSFLSGSYALGYDSENQIPPTLMVLGSFSGNSAEIVRKFRDRSIQVHIAENFDVRLACSGGRSRNSPLYWERERMRNLTPNHSPSGQGANL